MSVQIVDNDHYGPVTLYESGTHKLPEDTKYLLALVRIQIFDPKDPAELTLINKLGN